MSLRIRLLLAVGLVALVALGATDVAVYAKLHSYLYKRVDASLQEAHIPIDAALSGSGPGGHEHTVALVGPGTFVQVVDDQGQQPRWFTTAYARLHGGGEAGPRLPATLQALTSSGQGEAFAYFTAASAQPGGPSFRVRVSSLGPSRLLDRGGYLFVAVPLDDTIATLHRLLGVEIAVTLFALGAALVLGFWLVRVGLRPLRDVETTAAAIAEGDLDRRVPGDTSKTEVGRVASALNVMLARIEDAFATRDATEAELRRSEERLRRFVADASHELRTPLAAVSAYAQLFERGAKTRPADLARVMEGIRAETARMGRLVEDLLLLARLDEGRPLERKPVELVALASEAAATAATVGPEWPVRLEAGQPVDLIGDPARLRQVVDNLLANVRAHTPAGTAASLRVGVAGSDAVVEVADHGPGLGPEDLSRVFERFYRADSSRSRQHGGTGLGLGIVAAIVAAHGGSVRASATPGGGATFTVRLPRTSGVWAAEGVAMPAGREGEQEPAPSRPRQRAEPL